MASRTETPFYQKLSFNLITLALICVALIYGKDLLLPLLFSILLANILLPVTKYLSRKKLNKVLSIFLPLLFSLLVVGGLIYFLSSQIMHFMDDVPVLHDRVNELTHSFQVWFRKATTITITPIATALATTRTAPIARTGTGGHPCLLTPTRSTRRRR